MHIVMLSDLETQGGAAIAVCRMADAFYRIGHHVTRLVNTPDGQRHSWNTVSLNCINSRSLSYRLRRKSLPWRIRNLWDRQNIRKQLNRVFATLSPDVIHIHNLHKAINSGWSPNLPWICTNYAPTIWTLHDMWSFTGRCAYSYDCRKFITGCDATCPTPTEYPALSPKRIAGAWEERRRLLTGHARLVAVTPSRWLAQEAQFGLWAGRRVEVIPHGLPLDVYRPIDRGMAREALGINTTRPVLLMAAENLNDRRKGANFLMEALRGVSRRTFTLITLGAGALCLEAPGVDVHSLGYIHDKVTKALVYNAADIFVHPAPVDNLPNVIMEAMACGTPAVSFPVGGIPEMVRPGQTGWLAKEISTSALAETIDTALGEFQRKDWRTSCRMVAETEYSDEKQARRYIELFESLRPAYAMSPA